ncbi:hypothetical protein BU198_32295 [Streptomyces sp. CBMA156]|nr:hypothetical protein [Streptomyces sp. CBMA156]
MVQSLLEQGQSELLIRAAEERGEWFCAEAAVHELCAAGEFERALTVLEPFVAVGWWHAVRESAEVMIRQGRIEEGLALVRPDAAGLESAHQSWWFADLLVKAGRTDEAVEVLTPHLGEFWVLRRLVEVTEGRERDERVLELLAPLAEQARRGTTVDRCPVSGEPCGCPPRHEPQEAPVLYARVLERMDRVDEAIRTLGADVPVVPGTAAPYAELLARQGRIDQLRELATGEYKGVALRHFVSELEELGRTEEAEAVLRAAVEPDSGRHRRLLMRLLARQGRIDEAVEAGRPAYQHDDDVGLLYEATDLLVRDGRPEQALELLDGLGNAYFDDHPDELSHQRLYLLGEAGRHDEGIAEAKALNEREPDAWDASLARLLEQAGRVDEAVGLLRSSAGHRAYQDLADLLIRQGRFAEAIAALPPVSAERAEWEAARSGPGSGLFSPF